ncbi:MAG: YbaK/EbsC family protein [Candidatus Nanopelagicales bacterium]|nr:YbaK/EbsC family protein [Candidatus Nanopelagicales bacterium]
MAKSSPQVPPATERLIESGIAYALHRRRAETDDNGDPDEIPSALGDDSTRLMRTMVVDVDDQPTIVVIPMSVELDESALAAALGGLVATPCDAERTERLTGYPVDNVSPLATREQLPVIIDVRALDFRTIYVSAGSPGTYLELRPGDLVTATGARTAPLSTDPT